MIERIFAEIGKKSNKKEWICLAGQCDKVSINSHFLQKNGILKNLADQGFLVETKLTDPNHWKKTGPIEFKKIGINQALSLNVFCSNHDSNIFKSIEDFDSDLTSFKSFLLFSYRVTCAEVRKKQIHLDSYTQILEDERLDGKIKKEKIESYCNGFYVGCIQLVRIKFIFEDEIRKNSNSFIYYSHVYEKIDVYASAIFSPIDDDEFNFDEFEQLQNVYIHVIPRVQDTLILVGYHKDYSTPWTESYVKSWGGLSRTELEFKLTDLFAERIENWGMSNRLYKELKDENIHKYINYIKKSLVGNYKDLFVEFNLFEK